MRQWWLILIQYGLFTLSYVTFVSNRRIYDTFALRNTALKLWRFTLPHSYFCLCFGSQSNCNRLCCPAHPREPSNFASVARFQQLVLSISTNDSDAAWLCLIGSFHPPAVVHWRVAFSGRQPDVTGKPGTHSNTLPRQRPFSV